MPNTQFIEDHKQENLEIALDHLCKATGRDIAIFYPTKANEIVPYLIKEIKLAIKGFDEDKNSNVKSYDFAYSYLPSSPQVKRKLLNPNKIYSKTITTDGGENRAREIFKIDYDFGNIDLLEVRIV
jgi:hypothetical protein